MSTMLVLDDTIAALATAPGASGLAVIRVSGRDALRVAGAIFRGAAPLEDAPSHTLHHGWAVWPEVPVAGEHGDAAATATNRPAAPGRCDPRLDEIVAAVFRAPRSYTREDVVELSCHGGERCSGRVLAALLAAGARPARPGEFTLRAFLNGRLDLAQAEAVADLIHASTERAREIALSQLAGSLSARLAEIAERIADAAAEVEARVDFAEDVGGVEVPGHVRDAIAGVSAELGRWLEGAAYARAVREGARVPIVGRPNVGKSSLFNALVGEPRAIVTPIPGTTRDRVSESIELEGIRVTISDTAGLRETEDPVEALGVAAAERALEGGAVALWALDASAPLAAEDRAIAGRLLGRRVLVALNKSDRPACVAACDIADLLPGTEARVVRASALRGDGIEELKRTLGAMLAGRAEGLPFESPIGNPRHVEALSEARLALERAEAAAQAGSPGEIVALELRESLEAIGQVTGASVGEDLLDRIFGRFCIGK